MQEKQGKTTWMNPRMPPMNPNIRYAQGSGGMPIDPVTASLIAGAAMQGIGGIISGNKEAKAAKAQERLTNLDLLIELLQSEAERRQQNAMGVGHAQIAAPLMQATLDSQASGGTNRPFSPVTALLRPQTFQTQGQGGRPGVSLQGPGGPEASPEELSQLVPNFQQFQALREQGRMATQNITPQNLFTPREGVSQDVVNTNAFRSVYQDNPQDRLQTQETLTRAGGSGLRPDQEELFRLLRSQGVGR